MLGVRLDKETDKRLSKLAKKSGHTKSYYVRIAIKEFLDAREDYLLGLAALERDEDTISLQGLRKKLSKENRLKDKKK